MKNKILCALISSAMIISTIPISAAAETTYASANDFIKSVLKTATTNIGSTSKDTAIDNVVGNITTNGDEVLYEGNSIGYWYIDDSDCLYSDSSKTTAVIENGANGYTVDASLLSNFLEDVNEDIVEVYEPTSTNWSKIIGKYDVTLGDTVIPMSNWVDFSNKPDDYFINISRITGITAKGDSNNEGRIIWAFSWLVNENGELYISTGIEGAGIYSGNNRMAKQQHTFGSDTASYDYFRVNNDTDFALSSHSWITLDAKVGTTVIDPTFSFSKDASLADTKIGDSDIETFNTLRSINDPSIAYTGTIDNATNYGVVYFITTNDSLFNFATMHNNFWTTFETTKTVNGNEILAKRISKISNLGDSDALVISTSGWTVNGISIDNYIGTQFITDIDGAADMGVSVEVESKSFKVTLPTTLPVYISQDGTVTTATNAEILNESNAAISITDVDINAKSGSDWTHVDTTPSTESGSKEFSFTTSLNPGDVLAAKATLPFTYDAAFSPDIFELENIDIANVVLTFGWAN